MKCWACAVVMTVTTVAAAGERYFADQDGKVIDELICRGPRKKGVK